MKCFGLGMRRDWIMTEVEREEKKRKIAINRGNKKDTPPSMGGPSFNHNEDSSQESLSQHVTYPDSQLQYNSENDQNPSLSSAPGSSNPQKPIRRRRRRRRNPINGVLPGQSINTPSTPNQTTPNPR